ncbi:ATP-utilizing enzyme of the PP-loop superfamily [Lachnospiraceae bacterium KM106-2]|nr:ATP-utilizing enzyme of the PP-loop superfamily [Lachnospiraceae bacterium KM106-2]
MKLKDFFSDNPKIAIAFSGGVDSSYLLYVAKKYATEVRAYYIKTPFQPKFELDDAILLASQLNVTIKIINLNILLEERITSNPKNRCYYCKKLMFTEIITAAKKDGFSILLDGTNASDDVKDRPGMAALHELAVLSPLRLCGLTKDEIRNQSKAAGLFTWNKPAYACLATRIQTGQKITEQLLSRTENAENYLSSLGFTDFRIRTFHDCAQIQIRESQLNLLIKDRNEILETLGTEYKAVLLDLEVRNE